MRSMTNQELEAQLAQAVDQLQPDLCRRVSEMPLERALDIVPQPTSGRKMPAVRRFALAACLCLVLLGGGGAFAWLHPTAQIGLEVNPSIQLTTNAFDRVLSAEARNPDGEVVLSSLQLRGVDLDTAVSAIIGSIVQHGYFASGGEVQISVVAGSQARILRLEQQVSEDVRNALPQESTGVAVTVKPPQTGGSEQAVQPAQPATPQPPSQPTVPQQPVTEPVQPQPTVPDATSKPTEKAPTQTPPSQSGITDSNGKQAWIDRALALDPTLDAKVLQTYSTKQLRELVEDLMDRLEDEIDSQDDDKHDDWKDDHDDDDDDDDDDD